MGLRSVGADNSRMAEVWWMRPQTAGPILAGLGIIALLLLFLVPIRGVVGGFRKGSGPAYTGGCYANIRVLLGAFEMYNMDHTDMMKTVSSRNIAILRARGYLKMPIECPGEMAPRFSNRFVQTCMERFADNLRLPLTFRSLVPGGTYEGSDIDTTGRISCSLHGTVE